MTDTLIACTDAADPERVHWLDGQRWEAGDWRQFIAALGQRAWVLLMDGSRTTVFEATLPVSDLATARRAAPYAVEEQLAQPIEETHLAVAPLSRNQFAVAATARAELEQLKQRVQSSGLKPELVVPECCALPWSEGSWCIVVRDDWALLRTGASCGLKIPFASLADVVPQLREEYPHTARVEIHTARAREDFPLTVFAGLDLHWHGPLERAAMVAAVARPGAPVLFDASARAAQRGQARRLWWAAACAALLLAIAYPLLLALGNASLARTESALAAANSAVFSAAFPTITRVVNPRVQAEQAIARLRANSVTVPRFLDLLADFESAFKPLSSEHTAVRSLAYAEGVLEVGVETADMAELDRVRGALQTLAMKVDMLSAESTDSGVIARLRVRETP